VAAVTAGAHPPRYRLGEEIANSVTHGVGLLLAVAGLVVLVTLAAVRGTAWHVVGCSIYGSTLVLLYAASTLYHSIPNARAKRVFRVIDHSAIFLLIAGTYTPFTLINLRGPWGWSLFGVVWGLALFGILFQTGKLRHPVLSVVLYVLMGWTVVIATRPLLHAIAPGGLALLVAGGLAYTLGITFYAWKRLPYGHSVWHGFVLLGSAFHFFAILFFVVPS
jgi:hemolysin III